MKYTDVIKPECIAKYSEMQKSLFIDLNSILFDIIFLKKCIDNNGINMLYDTNLVIGKLFNNEFQYLIIKVARCLFDKGSDTITLLRFKNMIFKEFIKDEYKESVQALSKNSKWFAEEAKEVKTKVESCITQFRNHYLAHSLQREIDDISVSLLDIEKLFDAATDLFCLLSFEPGDLYGKTPTDGCTFTDERNALVEFCDMFFDYQYLSSPHIEHISYKLDEFFVEEDEKKIIEQHVSAINNRKR